jgi:hypothetical protein
VPKKMSGKKRWLSGTQESCRGQSGRASGAKIEIAVLSVRGVPRRYVWCVTTVIVGNRVILGWITVE